LRNVVSPLTVYRSGEIVFLGVIPNRIGFDFDFDFNIPTALKGWVGHAA
jgi:hypothetical protein